MSTSYPNAALPVAWGLDWRNDKMSSSIVDCDNVLFNADGSIERLGGFRTTLTAPINTEGIFTTNLFHWRRESTGGENVIAAIGGDLMLTNGALEGIQKIDGGFTQTAYIGIASYGDVLHYGDGLNPNRSYDGTSSYLMSISEPTVALTASDGGSGSMADGGTFVYAFSYYNSVLGKESGISPTTLKTLTAGQTSCNLSVISASTDPQIDKKRIYRTTNGGSAFLFLAEITNATTTYDDVIADTGLGASLPTQYYSHLEPSSIFITQNNRMYMAGDQANPQRLYQSALFNPEFINTDESYFYDVDTQITAIIRVSTGLIIAEFDALWLFSGSDLDNMTIQKLSNSQGCYCQSAVAYIDEGYPVWVSGDTLLAWDGTAVQDLGKYISPEISRNVRSGAWNMSWPSLGYDPVNKLLWWGFA